MSIEGPGLYQDDTGHDVRSEFRELIGEGRSPDEATRILFDRWEDVLDDEHIYCAFHLALADTQWRLGRPVNGVVDAALKIIDTGRDLRRWEYNPQFHRKRKRILEQLRERISSAPPRARTVRKPSPPFLTRLETGDLVRYTAETGDDFLLAVVGLDLSNDHRIAIVRLMEWDWASSLSVSSGAPLLRLMRGAQPLALMPYRGTDLPSKRAQLVTQKWPVPAGERQDTLVGSSVALWGVNLDWQLRRDRQHHQAPS